MEVNESSHRIRCNQDRLLSRCRSKSLSLGLKAQSFSFLSIGLWLLKPRDHGSRRGLPLSVDFDGHTHLPRTGVEVTMFELQAVSGKRALEGF